MGTNLALLIVVTLTTHATLIPVLVTLIHTISDCTALEVRIQLSKACDRVHSLKKLSNLFRRFEFHLIHLTSSLKSIVSSVIKIIWRSLVAIITP